MRITDDDLQPWEMTPEGNPLSDKDIEVARKSKYYVRFAGMIRTVPSIKLKSEAWKMLSNIHTNMDQMRTFRSGINSRKANMAIRVAIVDSGLTAGGSGCLINRHFEAPRMV